MNSTASPPQTIPQGPHHQTSRILLLAGLAIIVGSCVLAYLGREPFATWLFAFAWWGYIFFVDAWVYRRKGESLLLTFPGRFFFLAGWSVVLWFVFELCNLRLRNWFYVDMPGTLWLRWLGYALSFATVVPGILETADLIEASGLVKKDKVKALGWKKGVGHYFVLIGFAMIVLALVWPKYFFPLVWGGFVFLLEPLNERLGGSSLLSDWRAGHMRRFFILLVAGFFCGVLWESWNALARAHWVYEIPFVGDLKIFEMPVLGYLGFPPFAIEAFVMSSLAVTLWERTSLSLRAVVVLLAVGFCLAMGWSVDHFTVRSFQS